MVRVMSVIRRTRHALGRGRWAQVCDGYKGDSSVESYLQQLLVYYVSEPKERF